MNSEFQPIQKLKKLYEADSIQMGLPMDNYRYALVNLWLPVALTGYSRWIFEEIGVSNERS